MADRVVQASLKAVLEPIFEADFASCSYGFRPNRRAQDAIAEIHFLGSHFHEWVLEADIQACFDEIGHTPLLERVRKRIKDKRVLGLVRAFLKSGVMTTSGVFEDTLSRLVILAVFLPVMAGQTGNTGCQALAVTLRGMTLGDVKPGAEASLVRKEGTLGFINGTLVGITAGLGMTIYAAVQGEARPVWFGLVVFVSMICACTVSGIAGSLIPLTLKKLGADPATASSIFLTTASDVTSMGIFLTLATLLL